MAEGFANSVRTIDVDARDFARQQNALGENPIKTIKEVRARYGLELQPARALVVTPEEIEKFLRSTRASGATCLEARVAVKRRFGGGGKEALKLIDGSGLWSDKDGTA